MKTAIIYYSKHHGNTKKLLEAIAGEDEQLTLFDVTKDEIPALEAYDRIGLASGVYFSKYGRELLEFTKKFLPEGKPVFFIHTAGSPREKQNSAAKTIAEARNCECLGTCFCKGFDTFGPFRLIGGLAKGHPDEKDIKDAVNFYRNLR